MNARLALFVAAAMAVSHVARVEAQAAPYYQWQPLAVEASVPWEDARASRTTWVWVPAATFVRVRTSLAPAHVRLVRVEVGDGGHVAQPLPAVGVDGGVGVWHIAGTGAYLGVAAPEAGNASFVVERAVRRQPAWAATQLRLGLWAWLFRGQPFETALVQHSELDAFLPLAMWAYANDEGQGVRAAIWDFFVTRSLGVMASSVDTARATLTPAPCLMAADGTATMNVQGPAWVRISAHQPVATWRPWIVSVSSPSPNGAVLRGQVSGVGSPGRSARLAHDEEEEAQAEEIALTSSVDLPSRALVQRLWLPAATTELTLRATTAHGATAACFNVTATRPRSAWFTPALRAYPVTATRPRHPARPPADMHLTPPTTAVVAEAMSAGARLLDKDDSRLVDMWTAFYALARDKGELGRDAAVGMAMLIAEQAQSLEAHEADRLLRVTAKRPGADAAKALVVRRQAAAAGMAQAVADASAVSSALEASAASHQDVLAKALASALGTPADMNAREALLTAWRNGRWTMLQDFLIAPLASAPRVTVLSSQRTPADATNTWFALAPGQPFTVIASAPDMAKRRQEDALMAKWRVLIRSSRVAVTVQINGQPHTLAMTDGIALGEWFLPLGSHTVAWDGVAGDMLFSSLPSTSPDQTSGTTAQLFTRLPCDATWKLTAPSLPYLRISATSSAANAKLPMVRVTPDRGEPIALTFSPQGEMNVTTQGHQMLRPMGATVTMPLDATMFTVGCDGADHVWLSVQQRSDGNHAAVDELAAALAMLRLPEATPAALTSLTAALRTSRDATTLAKRAYIWWTMGHSELAKFDAISARHRATTAEQREIALMLAPLTDDTRLIQVPPQYQTWAQTPQLVASSGERLAACYDASFGGDAQTCLHAMLARYERDHSFAAAIAAARAYLTLTNQGEASAPQSLAIYAATTSALQLGFHPALQWARSASTRGTTRKLIMAVDDSAGSMSITRQGPPVDVETGLGAKTIALDAPWDESKGLIVLDHGAGAALRLAGGRTVRLGLWCQPLRDDVTDQPACNVTWRLNQRPVEMLAVAPRAQAWHAISLPPGTSALAFDLVAPMRDRLVGIVVMDGEQPIIGQTQQKAFRAVAGYPVVVRVAGPTVITVERVAGRSPGTASATATLGDQVVALAEGVPVDLAVTSAAPSQLTVATDGEAAVLVRVRVASNNVQALPPLADDATTPPRRAFALPTPAMPDALPAPRAGRVPTFTARLRVGIERQDDEGALGSAETVELEPTMASASVVETRLGVRRRFEHRPGQTWLALDAFARRFNSLPTSPGAELTLNTRWWNRAGLHASGRYTYATTGLPEGVIILGQEPRAHVGRVAVEAYGQWANRQWFLRPSLLYRNNWASDAAKVDVDTSVWNTYVSQMPLWYEGAMLAQWSPSLDTRVALTPRVRWDNVAHLETLSARLRLSGLLAQRRWGGVYVALAWQPQYWVANPDAVLLRLDPYFAHQGSFAVDFLRQWRRQWWFKLGFRGAVQYVKGQRNVTGWVQFEFTKSQRHGLDDMLPSEQEFDQLTNGRVWADENY